MGASATGKEPCPPNVVTPNVLPEYKVVLLDRKLSKHLTKGDTPSKILPDPTYVYVWASQTAKTLKPWKATGEFKTSPENVHVFLDKECKTKLTKGLTHEKLTGAPKQKLWLRGVKGGKFKSTLTLKDPGDKDIKLKDNPAEKQMGVVELKFTVHQHDAALANKAVNPDQEPESKYHTDLKKLKLPDQKKLSDEDKVKKGRLLHEQSAAHFGRAKLVINKLDASQWPGGTDSYEVALGEQMNSGGLAIFDKEFDGTKKPFPVKYKVSDLKAAERTLWAEGSASTKKWRDARLELGLDRAAAGPSKKARHNADWARFTVAKIKDIKLDYTPGKGLANAWDNANNKFFINLQKGTAGRKIKIGVQLSEPLENVPIHFMLAEHKDNRKKANWGVDLPAGPAVKGTAGNKWEWKKISANLKHSDKPNRKKLLHVDAKTDNKGYKHHEVTLSRLGGDKFYLAAYLDQDPHLAKYIDGHADLQKRKPVTRTDPVQVWRKFWYKEVKVERINVAGFMKAPDTWKDVMAVMTPAGAVEMKRKKADKVTPQVVYPKHMVSYYLNAARTAYINNYPNDKNDALVVGDDNESKFFKLAKAEKDKPVMLNMLNAHALWVKGGNTGAQTVHWHKSTAFPLAFNVKKHTIDPPIAKGNLLKSGNWEARDFNPATGKWVNSRKGKLKASDLELDPARSDPRMVKIKWPAGVKVDPNGTQLKITKFQVSYSKNYLGTQYGDGIVNAYTPNDKQDYENTINHESGHAFGQVATYSKAKSKSTGIPKHSEWYDPVDGPHCKYQNKSCLMYESGPQPKSLNRFCPICHPYVLVQDMSSV